jgi:hypothetical protein
LAIDGDSEGMIENRNTGDAANPVHLSFSEQRRPLVRGDAHEYLMARGDQLAFTAEVVRFGFSPTDFVLDIERVPGKRTPTSTAPTFTVTVRNIHRLGSTTYRDRKSVV